MPRWITGVNLLAILAVALMILALFVPWWSFQLEFTEQTDLYPYLLDGPMSEFVGYKRSPQMALLTGVIVFAIALGLVGSMLRGKAARIVMASSAGIVFLAAWRLLMRIAAVASIYNLPIQGTARGNYGGFAHVTVTTWLRPGTYLFIAGGVLILMASLLHAKVRARLTSS